MLHGKILVFYATFILLHSDLLTSIETCITLLQPNQNELSLAYTGNITDSGTSLGTALVGYVHNVSSVKRNKRNTLNYSTFTLQVGENSIHFVI